MNKPKDMEAKVKAFFDRWAETNEGLWSHCVKAPPPGGVGVPSGQSEKLPRA